MNLIKTGCAILNQTPLDWNNNTQNILTALKLAKKEKISLVCFPELSITGYGCEDAFHASYVTQESFRQLELILPHTKKMAVCLGLPVYIDHALFNGSAFICDGKLAGIVCKRFLAGEGVHYESRWFKPWPSGVRRTLVWKGRKIPVGDLVFKAGDFKIGIEICEDAWTSNRPAREFAGQGVNIVLNPSASHFAFGKLTVRKQILTDSSRFCQALYLYSNLNGCEAGRIIYDGGGIITFCGRELAQGKRFSYEAVQLLTAVADMDEIRLHKSRNPNAMPDFKKSVFFEVPVSWDLQKISHAEKPCPVDSWEHSPHLKKEEFTRAVGLGLYDYLRKSSSRGFVLSLSGGMDSSGIAVLIYYMVKQIGLELGNDELRKRFSFLFPSEKNFKADDILKRLLTCVYQSSKNSGPVTLRAAKELCSAIKASFHHLDISALTEKYTRLAEKSVGRKLSWERDDTSLQNIQARVRGPSVWMLANIKRSLLLTTSNRSEAAVGYATMDGDTCGGLAPIGGIDKNFLIQWGHWVRDIGPENLGNLPVMKLVTDQKPTAELRPPGTHQTDEKDLMPYWLLDRIEKAAIRDHKSPSETYLSLVKSDTKGISSRELGLFIKRFFTLWQQNQWKRERYAPSFHLDDENLDPKTWCRYPILSGRFEIEMKELDKVMKSFKKR